ncbi:MAG: S-layer homology domain-containing protein [Clostridia bacterium]|nr:S-layer homology domain-containing protein [Clostridia bacterium]MBN2882822.1 S-layer homology domain-containing protein [Clostridia bacterium]
MLKKLIPNLVIFLALMSLIYQSPQAASIYNDVQQGDWYYEYIENLSSMGIINGFPDGTFRPDEPLQGDQFIKMIVTALGYNPVNGTNYWASSYIDIAREIGLLEKINENNLKKPLQRGQIACIMSKALEIRGEDPAIDVCGLVDLFGYTPEEYIQDVLRIHNAGIITGYMDETFRYDTSITRAEACTVTNKLVTPITRREHQITSLTPVPVCYSVNRDSHVEFLNKYEGNVNCLFSLQKIKSGDIELEIDFNTDINQQVMNSMLLMADNISYPVIEMKPLIDKNIISIDLFNDSRLSNNSDYAMFSLHYYDSITGYPEKNWGYDTMFLKLDIRRLSDLGLVDPETKKPDVYYEYKVRGLMRLLFGIDKGDTFSEFILERYTEFSKYSPGEIPESSITLIYGDTRLVFTSGVAGRQLTFTFSED